MTATAWDKTKKWVKRNPTLSGALGGFAAGSIVPGVGNVVGALSGAVIGHMAGSDAKASNNKEGDDK
jgi:outer membrane lipoprotein SlyB